MADAKELELLQGPLRYFDAGSAAPIVFVHGLFVNANVWRNVMSRLRPDFRCVTLDLPPHSRSKTAPVQPFSLQTTTFGFTLRPLSR